MSDTPVSRDPAAPKTADQLRSAIDREGQGDKVDFPDPAAAPLGTDAEAAGNPPTRQELKLETVGKARPPKSPWSGFAIYILLAIVVFTGFLTLVLTAMS